MKGGSSFYTRKKKEREREGSKKISRCLHFSLPSSSRALPVSNSLNFLLLLSVPFDAQENFRNFARPFKASVRAKKRSSVYTSRSRRDREIKPGDFASFRTSLLFGLVLFVNRRFCINRNLSPPKTKLPWRVESWTEVFCCLRRALSRDRGRGWLPVYFSPPVVSSSSAYRDLPSSFR